MNLKLNKYQADILLSLNISKYNGQRELSESTGYSLGLINRSVRELINMGYLDENLQLTNIAQNSIRNCSPRNAIILAAGFGMRMVPINFSTPKAFLEVRGERLIERQIRQLNEVGITDITVVVGFMKESFDYLIDQFGVKLIVNPRYATMNNLYSLSLVSNQLHNTYIIPCDIWCSMNPYKKTELYSWYMVSDEIDHESNVRVNRRMELVNSTPGNKMVGIAYLTEEDSDQVSEQLIRLKDDSKHGDSFWEEALFETKGGLSINANIVHSNDVVEVNTYEQLRDIDSNSSQLKNDAIWTICEALNCRDNEISNISVLKKGMTNRSFLFTVKNKQYIMRIPGEGTDQLINRAQEAAVYHAISGLGLCDDPVYINPKNGYKITRFLNNVRVCDSDNPDDLVRCMKILREFHEKQLKVNHVFDIFSQIDFYESLWNGTPSAYVDYTETKRKVLSLKKYIDDCPKNWCLTHIDAVPDNFLFYSDNNGEEKLQLTDWEYSGLQDPHVDIAMFCIYSLYSKEQCDRLIDIYFSNNCPYDTRIKIYCYISACGLLWSNWCEYKRLFGVEFGEYSLYQYRFAKDYYQIANSMMQEI